MPATKAATPGQRLHRSSSTSRSLGTSPKPALGPTSASASTSGSVSAGNDNVPVKSANPIAPGRGKLFPNFPWLPSSSVIRGLWTFAKAPSLSHGHLSDFLIAPSVRPHVHGITPSDALPRNRTNFPANTLPSLESHRLRVWALVRFWPCPTTCETLTPFLP